MQRWVVEVCKYVVFHYSVVRRTDSEGRRGERAAFARKMLSLGDDLKLQEGEAGPAMHILCSVRIPAITHSVVVFAASAVRHSGGVGVLCVHGAVAAICVFRRIVGLVRGDGELGTSGTSVYAPPECVVYLCGAGRVLLLCVCVCVCQ